MFRPLSAIPKEALNKEKLFLITEQLLEYIQWLALLHETRAIASKCVPFI
jgi:hypothetical protein